MAIKSKSKDTWTDSGHEAVSELIGNFEKAVGPKMTGLQKVAKRLNEALDAKLTKHLKVDLMVDNGDEDLADGYKVVATGYAEKAQSILTWDEVDNTTRLKAVNQTIAVYGAEKKKEVDHNVKGNLTLKPSEAIQSIIDAIRIKKPCA